MGVDVFGIPLGIDVDLGTDQPVRGQRNRIRIAFDPGRAALQQRWNNAQDLHEATDQLDSLQRVRAVSQRLVDGTAIRLAALIRAQQQQLQLDSSSRALESPAGSPDTTLLVERPLVDPGTFGDTLSQGARGIQVPPTPLDERISALSALLEQQQRALHKADEALLAAQQAHQLQHALTRHVTAKAPLTHRITQGLRRFEVGSCIPEGNDFLINGVNLQGASITYAQKELYLALDHGRIMDDALLETQPTTDRLRQLQQSLFLVDARDLNPRRISALRFGYGLPEGTHVHVGFLRGSRTDLPPGSPSSTNAQGALINHAAELNVGLEIAKGHLLRFVYARSVVGQRNASADGNSSGTTISDLFGQDKDQADAVKLAWDADLQKTGTRFGVEARHVAPWYQSYGVGFMRTGSKAIEARMDQRISARARLRMRGTVEERTVVGESADRQLLIKRGQLALQFRPVRTITLSASYAPVITEWYHNTGPASFNQAITGSLHIRERWRSTVVSSQASVSHLSWNNGNGAMGGAITPSLSAQCMLGERWNLSATWTALLPWHTDTLASVSNVGVQAGWRKGKDWAVDAGAQFSEGDGPAWLAELRKNLFENTEIGARSQRFASYPMVQGGDAIGPVSTDHAFTLFIRCQW
jgi:hypothetical protein